MEERTFGNWLKGQRLQKGMSQGKLAHAIDVDRSYISRIESGNVALPGPEFRDRFHRFFGTSEQDLIDLGIVKQYDQWGREVDVAVQGETAQATGRATPGALIIRPETATATGQGLPPTVHSNTPDADAPLSPEEEALFAQLIFLGYSKMTNAQKRMLLETTKRVLDADG